MPSERSGKMKAGPLPKPTAAPMVTQLGESDPDYAKVKSRFQLTCDKTVVSIERVEHPLWHSYKAYRDHTVARSNDGEANEQLLFHGTDDETIAKITRGQNQCFDRAYTTVHAYGKGVYFARDALYSANPHYSKVGRDGNQRMILAKVAVGKSTRGLSGMVAPPERDVGTHTLYNSTVDSTSNPRIFVVYNDAAAYPAFIVTFKSGGGHTYAFAAATAPMAFSFGTAPLGPAPSGAFSFGSRAPAAATAPAPFSFGAAATAPPAHTFAFGGSGPAAAPPPFVFGAPPRVSLGAAATAPPMTYSATPAHTFGTGATPATNLHASMFGAGAAAAAAVPTFGAGVPGGGATPAGRGLGSVSGQHDLRAKLLKMSPENRKKLLARLQAYGMQP